MFYRRKSIIFQIGLLLTFLLPFYQEGCQNGESKVDAIDDVSTTIDSIVINKDEISDEIIDTLVNPILHNTDKNIPLDDISENKTNITFYDKMLKPNGNYSGIAYILDVGFFMLIYSAPLYSFVFLIMGLTLKLKNFNSNFIWFNSIGFLFHLICPFLVLGGLMGQCLWGYYICAIWWVAMLAIDFYARNKIETM